MFIQGDGLTYPQFLQIFIVISLIWLLR